MFTLHHDGLVTAQSRQFQLQTLCEMNANHSVWPILEANCQILIMADGVSLSGFQGSLDANIATQTAWKLVAASEDDHLINLNIPFLYEATNHESAKQNMFVNYTLVLRKDQRHIQRTLNAMIFAALIMMMLSLESTDYIRYLLVSISMILLVLALIPGKKFTIYFGAKFFGVIIKVLICAWFTLIMAMLNTWLTKDAPETTPPAWLAKVVNFSMLRFSIGLGASGVSEHFFVYHDQRSLGELERGGGADKGSKVNSSNLRPKLT